MAAVVSDCTRADRWVQLGYFPAVYGIGLDTLKQGLGLGKSGIRSDMVQQYKTVPGHRPQLLSPFGGFRRPSAIVKSLNT